MFINLPSIHPPFLTSLHSQNAAVGKLIALFHVTLTTSCFILKIRLKPQNWEDSLHLWREKLYVCQEDYITAYGSNFLIDFLLNTCEQATDFHKHSCHGV